MEQISEAWIFVSVSNCGKFREKQFIALHWAQDYLEALISPVKGAEENNIIECSYWRIQWYESSHLPFWSDLLGNGEDWRLKSKNGEKGIEEEDEEKRDKKGLKGMFDSKVEE